MVKPAPPIDSRNAAQIAQQVQQLLRLYAPAWQEFEVDPVTGDRIPKGISAALIGIFARYCEIIIQRLNQVPDKNFLAFLNLLGASRLAPQPAQVPLTFALAAGSITEVIVPARTQVAALPTEGETTPVIFETDHELVATATQLQSVLIRSLQADQYADWSMAALQAIAPPELTQAVPLFQSHQAIDHILYIRDDRHFSEPSLQQIRFNLQFEKSSLRPGETLDTRQLQWEIGDGQTDSLPLSVEDTTAGFSQDGTVTLSLPAGATLPPQVVNAIAGRWLHCRLQTPITPETIAQPGRLRTSHLRKITDLTLQTRLVYPATPIKGAIAAQTPIADPSLPFYPFGEKPKIGTTLFLRLADHSAFAAGGTVTLRVIVNRAGISPRNTIRLSWKFWNGKQWQAVDDNLQDNTASFTSAQPAVNRRAEPVAITFSFSTPPALVAVNGVEAIWLRVQIIEGDYGQEPAFIPDLDDHGRQNQRNNNPLYQLTSTTLVPPLISLHTVEYVRNFEYVPNSRETEPTVPQHLLTYNNFVYTSPVLPFTPFHLSLAPLPQAETLPTLYLGFDLAPGQLKFPNTTFSLYWQLAEPLAASRHSEALKLTWEYWDSWEWVPITIQDNTENLTRSGLVKFVPPADIKPSLEFGQMRYWLRIRQEAGQEATTPQLQRILLNTTIATQAVTVTNEILGSSDGSENQRFRTRQVPVLEGQELQVQEPELPSQSVPEAGSPSGTAPVTLVNDASGQPLEIWVRWCEVTDFYTSGARDRHYLLNHLTGEIQFGNGLNGLIPPPGIGNIRMTRYRSGGGAQGNRPLGAIAQLKTTVPYVERVTNLSPATGGSDAETLDSLLERMPRTLRHRGRAVTVEDYEDLAKLASPDVARAKGLALQDLDQAEGRSEASIPGRLTVIIVPHSNAAKPVLSLQLLHRIQDYLRANGTATAGVSVVSPQYVKVSVTAEIVPTSLEGIGTVKQAVDRTLATFLHPLTGGLDGRGWDFGREPHKSDLYYQIEAVPGVDHIRHLRVDLTPDNPVLDLQTLRQMGTFLVYSGHHLVNLTIQSV
jgi:hypothetical protein